jgi:hypothetical protein
LQSYHIGSAIILALEAIVNAEFGNIRVSGDNFVLPYRLQAGLSTAPLDSPAGASPLPSKLRTWWVPLWIIPARVKVAPVSSDRQSNKMQ